MERFDELLRRGLMDANLAQYENVLRRAEGAVPAFSPRYLQERTRLLADPWGWRNRRERAGRLRRNWRLIAIAAALLLLSACAYAIATGQFSQWFSGLGVNPAAPKASEDVMSRTSAVIEQTKTIGDTAVTLNAALWDGNSVYLSVSITCPDLPEEASQSAEFYTQECRLLLREDQWEAYVRKNLENFYAEARQPSDQMEDAIQAELDRGQSGFDLGFHVLRRSENTLTIQLQKQLLDYVEQPELTLHLENIALCKANWGPLVLDGSVDFTFALAEPIRPIRYGGAAVEVTTLDVPLRFTEFQVSVTELSACFDVLAPVDMPMPGEAPNPDNISIEALTFAVTESVQGLWTADGSYVDLTETDSSAGGSCTTRRYPYPIDPAAVTAVDLSGIRVELRALERLTE